MTEIHDEITQRLEELSDVLGIDKSIITSTSIIFGLHKYLLPYQKRLGIIHDEKFYKKTDEIDEFKDNLKSQIESDYDVIKDIKKVEQGFESRFQDKTFNSSEEYRDVFLHYLEAPAEQKIEHVEVITEEREPMASLLKRTLTKKKPEKKKIKKERPELPIKLLPKERIGMYFFSPSVLLLILFMFIWMFFPELRFLHGYSGITVSVLLSLIGIGLVIHYRQVNNCPYFIHRHGLFFIFATMSPIIIFTTFKFSEGYIWIFHPLLSIFFLIIIPLCIMGFIAVFYYHYFPSLDVWKDKRNVKKMTYRFIAENPYGTFKNSTERTQAFGGFIQDPNKVGDLLE